MRPRLRKDEHRCEDGAQGDDGGAIGQAHLTLRLFDTPRSARLACEFVQLYSGHDPWGCPTQHTRGIRGHRDPLHRDVHCLDNVSLPRC
jgi:hypothetical protein